MTTTLRKPAESRKKRKNSLLKKPAFHGALWLSTKTNRTPYDTLEICWPSFKGGPFRLLRNKDRGADFGIGQYFWKISIGTTILHLRGTPSSNGGSSHSNVSATTGSSIILSSGCMSRWGRQLIGNGLPESPFLPSALASSPITIGRGREKPPFVSPHPWLEQQKFWWFFLKRSWGLSGIRLNINGL